MIVWIFLGLILKKLGMLHGWWLFLYIFGILNEFYERIERARRR